MLITGGYEKEVSPGGAELFDPAGNGGVGSFTETVGSSRAHHTATLLPSGKVLLVGGYDRREFNSNCTMMFLASAELYDPAGNGSQGSLTPTGSLDTARADATATLLPNGKVLIAGGAKHYFENSTSCYESVSLASAEIWDPDGNGGVGSFTTTGSLGVARTGASAALLRSGKTLIAGGYDMEGNLSDYPSLASAELFDPAANGGLGAFVPTGSLATQHFDGTATLLPNGKVLFAGGRFRHNGDSYLSMRAEIYNPAGDKGRGSFTSTASLETSRASMTATLLTDGRVLFVGGAGSEDPHWETSSSAELYSVE